jgi:hypothetical protein
MDMLQSQKFRKCNLRGEKAFEKIILFIMEDSETID